MLMIDANKAQRKVLSYMASFIFSGEGLTPPIKDTDNPSEFSRGYVEGAKSLERIVFQKDNLVDAAPVKHGQWVDHCVRDWRCSECGEKIIKVRNVDGYCYDDKPNYCPNCGAKMDRYITRPDTKESEDDE